MDHQADDFSALLTDPASGLPLHLTRTEPLELEDLPLQVALLTMEVASLHRMLADLGALALPGPLGGLGSLADERRS